MVEVDKKIVVLQVIDALDSKGIAVRYHHWSGSHTLEVALRSKTDYEKSYTLFEELDNDDTFIPTCESVCGIDERNMILFMF